RGYGAEGADVLAVLAFELPEGRPEIGMEGVGETSAVRVAPQEQHAFAAYLEDDGACPGDRNGATAELGRQSVEAAGGSDVSPQEGRDATLDKLGDARFGSERHAGAIARQRRPGARVEPLETHEIVARCAPQPPPPVERGPGPRTDGDVGAAEKRDQSRRLSVGAALTPCLARGRQRSGSQKHEQFGLAEGQRPRPGEGGEGAEERSAERARRSRLEGDGSADAGGLA